MSGQEKKIESILLAAVEIQSESERTSYLDRACEGDGALRDKLSKMVADHFRAGDFLERPAVDMNATEDPGIAFEQPGASIGRYKLLQVIGEGGFGVVYMAEQVDPVRRRVALKIIKPGMDTKAVIARFEAERQALALMDHPNIAKVLDGGTTSLGRPYFVMELVRGVPLTQFCDENKLNTTERLNLFVTVCQAVQHAHQKGVIHRDLKPPNILVAIQGGEPTVKIIDFGVAKAINQQLTVKTLFTSYGQVIGTLQYMSPEQAEMSGTDIDTRSDVYSLGIVLYELLTGTTPIDQNRLRSAGYAEMQRLIREVDPPSPSVRLSSLGDQLTVVAQQRSTNTRRLPQMLRGELDWIVLKALSKDRQQRYESASEFGLDVKRFLSGDTVAASSPSIALRIRKSIRRNKVAFTSASLIVATLLLGLAATTWQMWEAWRQRDRAVTQTAIANKARRLAERHEASLRQSNYAYAIEMAFGAWQMGSLERLDALLTQQIPKEDENDLRGFEWRFLHARHRENYPSPIPYDSPVSSVSYSADGRYLAVATRDGLVQLRNLLNGHETYLVPAKAGSDAWTKAATVKFSPKSDLLVAGGGGLRGGRVRMWKRSADEQSTFNEVVFPTAFDAGISSVAVSPSGHLLVACTSGGSMTAIDLENYKVRWAHEISSRHDPEEVAFSPSGDRLVLSSSDDTMRLFASETGESLDVVSVEEQPRALAWSPTGDFLVMSDCSGVRRWTTDSDKFLELKPKLSWRRATCAAISPCGRLIACGGSDDSSVRIFDIDSGEYAQKLMHEGRINSVAFSADGKWLASGSWDKSLRIWRVPGTGPEALRLRGKAAYLAPFAVSADGSLVAITDDNHNLVVWDLRQNKKQVLKGHEQYIRSIAFCPSKDLIASAGWDVGIRIWDLNNGTCKRVLDGRWPVAFSYDGKRLAATRYHDLGNGLNDRRSSILIWDTETLERTTFKVETTDGATCYDLEFSPNGNYLASAERHLDGIVRVWRVDGQPYTEFKHPSGVHSISFSPDENFIASAGDCRVIKIWNLKTLAEHQTLDGYGHWFTSVAFSPIDGKSIVAASPNGEIRFWRTETGNEAGVLSFETGVRRVLFTPDGNGLAWGAMDGTVEIWSATPESQL